MIPLIPIVNMNKSSFPIPRQVEANIRVEALFLFWKYIYLRLLIPGLHHSYHRHDATEIDDMLCRVLGINFTTFLFGLCQL